MGETLSIGVNPDPFGDKAAENELEAEAEAILALADAEGSNKEGDTLVLVEDEEVRDFNNFSRFR